MQNLDPKRLATGLAALLLVAMAAFPAAAPAFANDDGDGDLKYLEVTVLDPEGKPMAEVEVEVSLDGAAFPMQTDDEGIIGFNVPGGNGISLLLKVQHEGFAAIGARWNEGDKLPEEFTIQMQKGVTIGGVVLNEDGQPVEMATVKGTILYDSTVNGDKGEGELRPMLNSDIATTDGEGRWQSSCAPEKKVHLQLKFSHPEYVADQSINVEEKDLEELRGLEYVATLRFGVDLRGRVLSPKDEPVVGAQLFLARHRYSGNRLEAVTDENGEYRIANAPPGSEVLTVTSDDWAPELIEVKLERGMEPLDVQLKPGNTVRIRVVDLQGEPVEGVTVFPRIWRSYETLDEPGGRRQTDADGIWHWDNAPVDEIRYTMWKREYQSTREEDKTEFAPREEPYEFKMLPAVVVTGNVVDKETGQPIEKFSFWEGIWWNSESERYTLQTSNEQVGRDGAYRNLMGSGCDKFLIKVSAEGYFPALSKPILPDEEEVNIDFELEKGIPPSGVVKLPDGSPVPGAEIALATPDRSVSIQDGEIRNRYNLLSTNSDKEGRFAFSHAESNYALICAQEDGWAYVDSDQFETSPEIVLQPWSQVSGQVKQGTQALAGEEVNLVSSPSYVPSQPRVNWTSQSETDDSGNFTFQRVKAGTTAVSRRIRYAQRGDGGGTWTVSHTALVEIGAGETAQVVVGGEGRILNGQLAMPDTYDGEISWKMGIVQIVEQAPSDIEEPKWQTYSPFKLRYASAIWSDGSFEVRDVLPGEYQLKVTLYPKVQPLGPWKPIGTVTQNLTVPESGSEPVDLGELVLETIHEKTQQ